MTRLYEIADKFREAEAQVPEGGELPEDLAARMDALGAELHEKIDACLGLFEELRAEAAAEQARHRSVQEVADRIGERAAASDARAARLKDYVRYCLERAGVKQVETGKYTARLQLNSRPTFRLENPALVPDEVRRVEVRFDDNKALELYKQGTLPAGIVVSRGTHLRVS